MIKINANDEIMVRLTDKGRRILQKNHEKLFAGLHHPYKPPDEVDGWSTWQLWRLMQEFGAHLHNGCDVPFETEMQLLKK